MPVPRESVAFDLAAGTAAFRMSNLEIPDYHDFLNSIGLIDPSINVVQGTRVSFDTRWQTTEPVVHLRDETKHFAGDFRESQATIVWSAREPALHFQFVSNPANTTNVSAVIGHERNGVYFS